MREGQPGGRSTRFDRPHWRRVRVTAAAALLTAALAGPAAAQSESKAASGEDAAKRGAYLAIAGDCTSCHTAPGGKPFAGGLVIQTPYGGISTPNLTPDKDTGLGKWTEDDFYRALHFGVAKNGEYLYPAMPYPNYTKVTRKDVAALWAYLKSLEPVSAPRKPNTLAFPFNVREGMAAWNLLFFTPGTYKPNPDWSDQVNRGAYLVEGLGHCGACHTPRNAAGATLTADDYSGGKILGEPYYAPDITGGSGGQGLAGWSIDQIVTFLKTGASKSKSAAFGPMEEAIKHSFSKLTESDLEAIAAYLKTQPDLEPDSLREPDENRRAGARLYMSNCAECHQNSGKGITGSIPPLDANNVVTAAEPTDVITAVLGGLPGHGGYGQMPAFGAALSDAQVASLINFVRTSWSNRAPANATADMVAGLRGQVTTIPQASDAARALGCPAVSESGAANALPDPGKAMLEGFVGITDSEMANRIGELVNVVRDSSGGANGADIVDDLTAAFCPIVAGDDSLSMAEKRARLNTFRREVESALAEGAMPSGSRVLLQVPLAPQTVDKVDAAARAAKQTRQKWLTDTIEKAAGEGAQ